jgi:hypothetical protein
VSFRVLVTGSRGWTDRPTLCAALNKVEAEAGEPIAVVHGACPTGADRMADEWAGLLGRRTERHPAQWDLYGRAAGFIRNADMVATRPDICLAFILDSSPGATDCADKAERVGIPTVRIEATSR